MTSTSMSSSFQHSLKIWKINRGWMLCLCSSFVRPPGCYEMSSLWFWSQSPRLEHLPRTRVQFLTIDTYISSALKPTPLHQWSRMFAEQINDEREMAHNQLACTLESMPSKYGNKYI